jgi:arachidonate 15-lipoxygenase
MPAPPPVLPQDEPAPSIRNKQLEDARNSYQFDHSYKGYALVAEVPKQDEFDVGYLANAGALKLELAANKTAAGLAHWADDEADAIKDRLSSLFGSGKPSDVAKAHAQSAATLHEGGKRDHPMTVEQYEALFPAVPNPASMTSWRQDWYFAWQRVAGCNPILIERVRQMPDHFPVTDALVAVSAEDDSLDAARDEGRLYLVDYPMLADVPIGETDGRPKYMDAPMLLLLRARSGELLPAAIQCGQTPGSATPIYTPADGDAWQMAKMVVQIADANFQGVVSHLGYCHLVMESVIVAAHRMLAKSHPLMILLGPHFEFTLAANAVAREQLISPDGNMDQLQSGTLDGSTALVQGCLARYAFETTDAPTAFAARGVDNVEGLPVYPFRDDGMDSYRAIERFADSYVRLYYQSAADVAADAELAAWVREMGDPKAGNLFRVCGEGAPATVEDVVMLVTRILYKCTTYHAGINYPSWDFLGYPPCMPAAGWGPGPSPSLAGSEEALTAMMTPLDLTFGTMDLMRSISMHRNHLGDYPRGQFQDARVTGLVDALGRELKEVEAVIEGRNAKRPVAYEYLLPSQIPLSIHV